LGRVPNKARVDALISIELQHVVLICGLPEVKQHSDSSRVFTFYARKCCCWSLSFENSLARLWMIRALRAYLAGGGA